MFRQAWLALTIWTRGFKLNPSAEAFLGVEPGGLHGQAISELARQNCRHFWRKRE